ncbi:MAG: diacylglycerol kinase family protein [Solobacterium sp.]|nr:diacylglycerol kinase family protein [Solobacterium sp.]
MLKKKFLPAFQGIVTGLRHPSIRLQFILGGLAVLAGIVLKLEVMEWVAVILCIGMVISLELMNTALEFLCNFITEDYHSEIKDIKDLSAGAVLAASIASLVTAVILLIRHI